jgi:DNA gyrase subunit A
MHFIKAPDFPTGGIIYGYQGFAMHLKPEEDVVVVACKAEIENEGGREKIIVREIPLHGQ